MLSPEIVPDVAELLKVIRREAMPKRIHFIELFLDDEIKEVICDRFDLNRGIRSDKPFARLEREIHLHAFLGYDVFCVPLAWDVFTLSTLQAQDTTAFAGQKRTKRDWTEEHLGPIQSWQDFEDYPWPQMADIDWAPLEWLEKNLPSNMGCYDLTASVFEMVSMLLGYESFCLKLHDDPDLVDAVLQKVGSFYVDFTRALCDFSCVRLIWGSDDMGFRTSTLVSDQILREKVLPWHRRCAQIAHEHGRPYCLHSCGELSRIMKDLIEGVGIDAKHSFEDVILPVTEAKQKYGDQIAILGGIDMDFLCRADEQAVRRRIRETLEICAVDGGYCLGTGNTVANYLPLHNYLAMLDEGRRFTL